MTSGLSIARPSDTTEAREQLHQSSQSIHHETESSTRLPFVSSSGSYPRQESDTLQ